MSSATILTVRVLLASPAVGAIVGDRIEPEWTPDSELPRIVVRQATDRQHHGASGPLPVRYATLNILCVAASFEDADALADTVIEALKGIRHAGAGTERITLFQDGANTSTQDPETGAFQRIIGFRATITG